MLKSLIACVALLAAGSASAQVSVGGYTRSNGTYVAPHVRSAPNSSPYDNYGSRSSQSSASSYATPRPLYGASPNPSSSTCSGYGCYGQPSATTGAPRTQSVSGYTRRDGTYVAPYYRSPQN